MSSMAKSSLLPEMVGWMTESTDTPYVALLLGMLMSFSLALVSYYDVISVEFKDEVMFMYRLSSYIIYAFLFVSYIIFKNKYSTLPRSFTSPLGMVGAVVGLFVFVVNVISVLIAMDVDQWPMIFLAVASVLMAIYYFLVLQANQQFSEEEKNNLFKAYLING